jgi:hypothetical protein
MWAEDGAVYITDAVHGGWWRTPFRGYAGYVQVLPRLLVLPVRWLPVSLWAAYCACAAALVTAILAALVHHWSEGWVKHRSLRLVVPALMVLAPVAYQEINADLTNLGWPLLVASVWAVLASQRTRGDVVGRTAVVVATALSTTLALLVVPFAIMVLRWRRTRADAIVTGALVGAVVVQGGIDLFLEPRPAVASSVSDLPAEVTVRIAGIAMVGVRWLDRLWRHDGWWFAIASVLAVVAYIALSRPCAQPRSRLAVVAGLLALSVALFVVPVWIRGTGELALTPSGVGASGARYDYVPIVLLVSALVLLIDEAPRRWLRALFLVQSAVVLITSASLANQREDSPFWADAVTAARATCTPGNGDAAAAIAPEGWFVAVPCARLR